ncbi:MAG: TetR/AcrR family transcriptional regulator [Oceanospirillaceae bacterium]
MQTIYNYARNIVATNADKKKRDRTKAAIQFAMCQLLEKKPLSTITIADVCITAKIAHGTFYIYFTDREMLVDELLTGFVDFIQSTMLLESSDVPTDPVKKTTAAYIELFEKNTGLMKCLLNHHEDFTVPSEQFHKLNVTWARIVVSAAIKKISEKPSDSDSLEEELLRRAFALGGMVDQYLATVYIHKDSVLKNISQDKQKVIETLSFIWKQGMGL